MSDKDIERLDGRIDKAGNRCDDLHKDLNKCLTEIKLSNARIEEQLHVAFGELEDGENAFEKINTRLKKVEDQQTQWKGNLATIAAGVTVVVTIVIKAITAAFTYFTSKGGG